MRTRAIRPGFWEDETMAELSVSARLTYIGLWCLADDAGYFEIKVPQIGAALFRYEPTRAREKRVLEAIAKLIEKGRVKIESCGIHAVIPTLPEYRYNAGVQIYTIQKKHEGCQPSTLPLGLEISDTRAQKGRLARASDISPSDSVSESVSESSTKKKATSASANGAPQPGGAKRRGSIDPDEEREAAIARARARIDDPKTTQGVKDAARWALQRMGVQS